MAGVNRITGKALSRQAFYCTDILKYPLQYTLSKFTAPAETFRLASIRSVYYALFQSIKVIGNNGSDEQKYIVYFYVEELYLLSAKIIH